MKYSPGGKWNEHYRGYELRINADGDIWWQVYNGTDRLFLDPKPTELVEQFLELKPLGGRVRVTEDGSVISRQEDESAEGSRGGLSLDDYSTIFIGELDLAGELVPHKASEFSVPVRPEGLTTGDLWPSVYDGARYSFRMNGEAWWRNSVTKKRHPVVEGLPNRVTTELTRLKPEGGSFRVTPWGDVVTLVSSPTTQTIRDQFSSLPRVIRNIIKLRRERADLQMVPVFVGCIDTTPLRIADPYSLTDQLSPEEQESLEGWAASLGSTTPTSVNAHKAEQTEQQSDKSEDSDQVDKETDIDPQTEDTDIPADDPITWLEEDMDKTEKRINDR